jgi:RNA polymerase sigma-70 factor (ECF subfamily)
MSQPDIESAIEQVKAGAVDQYRTVIAAFHQPLRAALAGACPPGIDANEIAHVTFIEAYRHLERYRSGSNFFAWLCAIARNQLLAESKRQLRQSRNRQNYLEHALTQRLLAHAEAHEELSETRFRLLKDCVALLNPAAQFLVDARYQQRRPIEDIAKTLSKTVSAVSVQLFSIRQKLRECVEKKSRLHVAADS